MSSLLDCLSDCQPKVQSDLMSFLNITSNELTQEIALLREVGLNIQEENEVYQLLPEMPLLNPQAISTALSPYSVHYHRTISSTNEFISRQIEQLKKVICAWQNIKRQDGDVVVANGFHLLQDS